MFIFRNDVSKVMKMNKCLKEIFYKKAEPVISDKLCRVTIDQ